VHLNGSGDGFGVDFVGVVVEVEVVVLVVGDVVVLVVDILDIMDDVVEVGLEVVLLTDEGGDVDETIDVTVAVVEVVVWLVLVVDDDDVKEVLDEGAATIKPASPPSYPIIVGLPLPALFTVPDAADDILARTASGLI